MKCITNKEVLTGAFFVVGIIAITLVVFILGGKTGLGESKYYVDVVFSDIGGLRVGAPVRALGVTVGAVVDISFIENIAHPDKRVKVTLGILSKYKEQVKKCTIYAIKTEGLLGDKLIDIRLPKEGQLSVLPDEEYIVGQDPLDIKNLADDFSETTKYFMYLSKKMAQMIEDLRTISVTSKRVLNRIEDRIIEGGLLNLFMGRSDK